MTVDLRFTKGSYSVGIYSDNVNEEYKNKLIVLSLPQSSANQTSGKKDTKILDLLKVTHQFVIKGYLTGTTTATSSTNDTDGGSTTLTAKQIKDNLITIANGAAQAGGTISMTYDGDTYTGYLESIVAIRNADDAPTSEPEDMIKYSLQLTFVVGVSV